MKITIDEFSKFAEMLNPSHSHTLRVTEDAMKNITDLVSNGDGVDFDYNDYDLGFRAGVSSVLGSHNYDYIRIMGRKIHLTTT